VASTLYIVAVVLLTALPAHFYFVANHALPVDMVAERFDLSPVLIGWLLWGTAGSLVLGVVATFLPLWLGFRAFRRFEI
jgi:hypothetical protein